MPDEGRPEPVEGRVAEHMIRVLMRIDDIEDGLVGVRADGGEQALPNRDAAAGVDHSHALVADHEADIGDVAQILFVHESDFARVDEYAWRDLLDRQRRGRFIAERAVRRERERGDQQSADEPTHGCQSEVLPAFLIVFAVCGGLWENLWRL